MVSRLTPASDPEEVCAVEAVLIFGKCTGQFRMINQLSPNLVAVRKIWSLLLSSERRSAVLLLCMMVIGMVLEALGAGLIIPVIELTTQNDYLNKYPIVLLALQALGNPSREAIVIGGMLGLVGFYLAKNLALAFLVWRKTSFVFEVGAQLSQRLFTIYLRQPYTFHLQRNSSQLIRNVIIEVSELMSAIGACSTFLAEALVLLGLCGLLLVAEPLGALMLGGALSVAVWGFNYFTNRWMTRWGQARQYHDGFRIQHIQQGLGGAKDVKLLGRETDFLEQYYLHNTQSAYAGKMSATMKQLPRLWLELLAVAGLAALVLAMLAQGHAMEAVLPMLGLFAVAAFRLLPSVNRVLGAVQTMQFSLPVINTLHAELQLAAPTIGDSKMGTVSFREMLELGGVSYTYPAAPRPALNDVSLVIRRGESVGFIGASGAGKSTLVDVVLGLLTPNSGEVRVDGRHIHSHLRGWQSQIGYVPQSIFLSDDTLRRNVAFGLACAQIDEAAIWRTIRAAQLEEFVSSLPEGLDTLVGERGVRLSGGQRQRIGIARALYHDPDVLVLDEATSSLDTTTERDVMQAVRALQGVKTILIVAHRLSTVEHCTRLYRLEHGRITAEGSPDDILHLPVGIIDSV